MPALLQAAKAEPYFYLLDSNSQATPPATPYNKGLHLKRYDWLAAWGINRMISLQEPTNAFSLLQGFYQNRWLFGYLGYGLKADAEPVQNTLPYTQGFAQLEFIEPQVVMYAIGNDVFIDCVDENLNPNDLVADLLTKHFVEAETVVGSINASTSKNDYLVNAENLLKHIAMGNIYEVNYCINFKAEAQTACPYTLFNRLNTQNPMPMAAFVKSRQNYLICASPERFIKKQGDAIYSQPIKGTAPRGLTLVEDEGNILTLQTSEKERAENVMIVDLVRNDLGRTAQLGSVTVPELFGVYTYPNIHQMVSTVQSTLNPNYTWAEAIQKAFAMGSMTGAPKISAMQLIAQHESEERGLFSGAVGYVNPDGDFDFNVVIRSILYNAQAKQLQWWAGSALTAQANPEDEYNECLLKTQGITKVLGVR